MCDNVRNVISVIIKIFKFNFVIEHVTIGNTTFAVVLRCVTFSNVDKIYISGH